MFWEFLVVQLLACHTFPSEDPGSTPSLGTKMWQAGWRGQRKKGINHEDGASRAGDKSVPF